MSYKKCEKCDEWHYENQYCADEFTIYHEDYLGDEGKKLFAYSFDAAAEKYARYYNSENELLQNSIDIEIEDKKSIRKKFNLSAEPDIHYSCVEI